MILVVVVFLGPGGGMVMSGVVMFWMFWMLVVQVVLGDWVLRVKV